MSLHHRVLRALREHDLASPGDRIAVALSGGADSVALVWLLHEIEAMAEWRGSLCGLVHVNHGLRAEESSRDEGFCRALADRLSLPIEVARLDVAGEARRQRTSIEAAARTARDRVFAEAAARLGAGVVATAHTLDDQAETVLLRLLRGAGTRGLAGIRRRRGRIIRPLLDIRRMELRAYLTDRGETFCHDSSNDDLAIARNRVRHQLLPVLDAIWPSGLEAIARCAALAGDDEGFLEQKATEAAASIVLSDSAGVQLEAGALATAPRALARRVIRMAVERAAPGAAFAAVHLEAVLELAAADRPSGQLDLPGLKVVRRRSTLYLEVSSAAVPSGAPPFERSLSIPGSVDVPEAAVTLTASRYSGPDPDWTDLGHGVSSELPLQDAALMRVMLQDVDGPLLVRSRRPGDRFRPFGAPGHRKVQDLLVDRKVPRDLRDRVPIVVDARGEIVWVVGHAIAEACRVTAPERGVVVLEARRHRPAST